MKLSEAEEHFPQTQVLVTPANGTEGLQTDPCPGVFWLELDYHVKAI